MKIAPFFWTLSMSISAKLRDLGIEGLKDKINKLKKLDFHQFLNSSIPELDPCPIFMQFRQIENHSNFYKLNDEGWIILFCPKPVCRPSDLSDAGSIEHVCTHRQMDVLGSLPLERVILPPSVRPPTSESCGLVFQNI